MVIVRRHTHPPQVFRRPEEVSGLNPSLHTVLCQAEDAESVVLRKHLVTASQWDWKQPLLMAELLLRNVNKCCWDQLELIHCSLKCAEMLDVCCQRAAVQPNRSRVDSCLWPLAAACGPCGPSDND